MFVNSLLVPTEITGRLSLVFKPNLFAAMVSHTNAMHISFMLLDITASLSLVITSIAEVVSHTNVMFISFMVLEGTGCLSLVLTPRRDGISHQCCV